MPVSTTGGDERVVGHDGAPGYAFVRFAAAIARVPCHAEPTMSFTRWMLLALVALVPWGCSRGSDPMQRSDGAQNGSPDGDGAQRGLPDGDAELARRLVGEGALLLDVRTPDEFADRHLDGAKNVPVDALADGVDEIDALVKDKTTPVVVYCKSGGRAARAKKMLLAAGYTQVTNLGGIDDWGR